MKFNSVLTEPVNWIHFKLIWRTQRTGEVSKGLEGKGKRDVEIMPQ